ncbi:MAG: hypothetical protein ABI865_06700, partial [Nitrosospira sp.]
AQRSRGTGQAAGTHPGQPGSSEADPAQVKLFSDCGSITAMPLQLISSSMTSTVTGVIFSSNGNGSVRLAGKWAA